MEESDLQWSRLDYGRHHLQSTFAGWLNDTSLFTQAWRVVCTSEGNWWWSKIICYWTVIYTVVMFVEGEYMRRNGFVR
jgi:alpha-1,2-mannosyltransferase